MKHGSTRLIFDYWNRQRGERSAPTRSEIDPAAIRLALGDTFMLAADFVEGIRFRLAGTRVCALFGREIKGERFNALWSEASRAQIANIVGIAVNEATGAVAGVTGRTEKGDETELELLLLPVSGDGRTRVRALGSLAPLKPPYWLGEEPVVELELQTLRHVGAAQTESEVAQFRSGAGQHTRHGFLVYSGGREIRPGDGTN
ncbi:MAG TPA: PAS domain-containing protein [Pseudolabrys sp.]|nr:PAS domain-containing protein [Pseudolabrys sp.]